MTHAVDSAAFSLHPQLQRDTFPICSLALSECLLMNQASFPWCILVPRVPNAREIIDLAALDRTALMDEISKVSRAMQHCFSPYKLNVAALGNQVEQLHIHIIARFTHDAAWPRPVWGAAHKPYKEASSVIVSLRTALDV